MNVKRTLNMFSPSDFFSVMYPVIDGWNWVFPIGRTGDEAQSLGWSIRLTMMGMGFSLECVGLLSMPIANIQFFGLLGLWST